MRYSTIVIFICLAIAAPAGAKWSEPFEPENSGVYSGAPAAATDATGAGVVAWQGPEFEYGFHGQQYVVAAVREPDGTIGPVQELNRAATLIDVASGANGRRAVLFDQDFPSNESQIAVSDGGSFAVERVPLPENQAAFGIAIEVYDDGSLTVLWDQSASESTAHLHAIRRAPDGSWGEAQQITRERQEFGSFTSLIDASGTTWAFWTGKADPSDPYVWAVFATYALPGEQFSGPAQISEPHRSMRVVGDRLPALANSRGDVAILDDAEVLLKAPGAGWFGSAGAPAGYWSSLHMEADLALDDAGNIYLAWRAGDVLGAVRPADGTFGRPEVLARNTGTQTPPMLAFDGTGALIYADNSDDGVIARVRPPDGSFSDPELIAPEGVWAYALRRPVPAGAGGLLLPWVTGAKPMSPGYDTTPHVAQFTTWTPLADQPAPVVRRLRPAGRTVPVTSARRERARRAAFRFKLSEPARVSLVFERQVTGKRFAGACYSPWAKVTGGPCETWIPFGGTIARKGAKGLNTVRLTRAQTKALATVPEVRLVVAATDRKHKRSRERRLVFRVR